MIEEERLLYMIRGIANKHIKPSRYSIDNFGNSGAEFTCPFCGVIISEFTYGICKDKSMLHLLDYHVLKKRNE